MRRYISMGFSIAILAIVLVPAPASAGGGCHGVVGVRTTTASSTKVDVGKCLFMPDVVRIDPGDTISWTNYDPIPHSVTGLHVSWGSEELLDQGDSASYTFPKEGVFPYYCLLHPGMIGAVVVGDGVGADADAAASISEVAPPTDATSEREPSVAATTAPDRPWLVPVASALIVAVLFLAAIPMRRRATPVP